MSSWLARSEFRATHEWRKGEDEEMAPHSAMATPKGRGTSSRRVKVWDPFTDPFRPVQVRVDFQLGEQIEAQLQQRKFKLGQTQTYRFWREMQKTSPLNCEALGFKDDPSKEDEEEVFVGRDLTPKEKEPAHGRFLGAHAHSSCSDSKKPARRTGGRSS